LKQTFANAALWTLLTLVLSMNVSLAQSTSNESTTKISTSNKWRMSVSGSAKSDGTIVLKISPKGGEPVTATIAIANKTGENDIAKKIVKDLKAQLSKDLYHIERDDGEDVLLKKKRGKPDFGLEIVSNDVAKVKLSQRKE
jgi:hypothetical protein